ncbi:MAG: hypothetical protein WCW52_03740 [Elusimicrobiales bacterium]|jgi:hypothetical protein
MNKLLSIAAASMLAMGTASAYADETCADSAVKAIELAEQNLFWDQYEPTLSNAKNIIAIADSCEASAVRLAAAKALIRAISDMSNPTKAVAEDMKNLCGSDAACAVEAINSLNNGLYSYQGEPAVTVARAIVEIVKQAPTETVKQKAIEVLSKGSSPAKEISEALAEVGKCE